MKREFNAVEQKILQHYVYAYYDPDEYAKSEGFCRPFYIGKGKGNRAFDHVNIFDKPSLVSDKDKTDKMHKIEQILNENKEPKIVILARGFDDDTALNIEMVLIDFIGMQYLTNEQTGHEADKHGRISLTDLRAVSKVHTMSDDEFDKLKEHTLVLKVNKSQDPDMTYDKIYDVAHAAWIIGEKTINAVDKIFVVSNGIVRAVFDVHGAKDWDLFKNMYPNKESVPDLFRESYDDIVDKHKRIFKKNARNNDNNGYIYMDIREHMPKFKMRSWFILGH
jgi:hypothetical protein